MACAPVREPFGLVPLEAMACSTPVVAIEVGGIQESVVHKQTGLLTDRNPERFSSATEYLLNNPSVGREYGHNGREHVLRHWNWVQATNQLEEHFSRVLLSEESATNAQ